ncbi:MAG: 23S rRNA (guanosine(2251)-2'-O)-methyltransferase RlmB [Spirochaetales bacterium]|nr:23S rRNA (guanosine(2251)-2'-O)-methyltransferase RlmB [Spirochaetales bacterium]
MEKIITGLHGIEEALKAGNSSGVLYISRKNARINEIRSAAEKAGVTVTNIPPAEMNKRYGQDNRGVVLKIYESGSKGSLSASGDGARGERALSDAGLSFEQKVDALTVENALIVILDGVTDPHNYGAILRSADQLGVDLVVSRARRAVSESDTVARTSAGAVNYVDTVVVNNLGRAVDYLKKNRFWVYGADMNGSLLWDTNLAGRTVIVMGSEGKGVSRLVAEKCDGIIRIPSLGRIDSLNVSVAAGVIMYEVRRQQKG